MNWTEAPGALPLAYSRSSSDSSSSPETFAEAEVFGTSTMVGRLTVWPVFCWKYVSCVVSTADWPMTPILMPLPVYPELISVLMPKICRKSHGTI